MHPGVQLQSQTSSNRPPTAASKHPSAAAAHSGQPPPRRRSTAGGCTRCATCSSSCPSRCSAARARTLNWCRRRATRCGCASTLGSGASVVPRLRFYLCHSVWVHRIKIGCRETGVRGLGGLWSCSSRQNQWAPPAVPLTSMCTQSLYTAWQQTLTVPLRLKC